MITVRRAAQRYVVDAPGLISRHCFSAGGYYEANNLAFGPLIACDEHLLEPGAGFARHAHARVELLSWVCEGTLRHEDDSGRSEIVRVGDVQYQRAGTGIEHVERNASDDQPLRFIQFWLTSSADESAYRRSDVPLNLDTWVFDVVRACSGLRLALTPFAHLYASSGEYLVAGHRLEPGDSLRARDEELEVTGSGELLVLTSRPS